MKEIRGKEMKKRKVKERDKKRINVRRVFSKGLSHRSQRTNVSSGHKADGTTEPSACLATE
jgi:hypothetical protein